MKLRSMTSKIPAALLLFALWIALSGMFKPMLLILGVLSVILVVWLSSKLATFNPGGKVLSTTKNLYRYIPWLLVEIVKSNLIVTSIIFKPANAEPKMVTRTTSQTTDVGRTIHANSITLTPGTISVDIDAEKITVHALNGKTAAGVLDDTMDQKVTLLER